RDDVVRLGLVGVVVDADHDRHVGIGRRRGDDHLLRATLEMLLGTFALREEAGRLDHEIDAEVSPGKARRVLLGEELDLLSGDGDLCVSGDNILSQRAEDRVVAEQVRHRLEVAEVVCSNHLEVPAALQVRAEEVAPNPPETVDSNPNRHRSLPHRFRPECIRHVPVPDTDTKTSHEAHGAATTPAHRAGRGTTSVSDTAYAYRSRSAPEE